MYETIRIEKSGVVGWLVLNRPDKLNALNTKMLGEALEALEKLEGDSSVKFVAVTGEGKAFSAGLDLSEVAGARDPDGAGRILGELAGFFKRLLSLSKPVIMAVNGHAFGGGAELLWAGDLVVAVRGARISWAETLWNLVPPLLPTIGVQVLGPARAALLALAVEEITSEEAYRLGLVSRLVDSREKLREEVEMLTREIMRSSPYSVKSVIRMLRVAKISTLAELGISELERMARHRLTIEAARKFLESKKPPNYRNLWLST